MESVALPGLQDYNRREGCLPLLTASNLSDTTGQGRPTAKGGRDMEALTQLGVVALIGVIFVAVGMALFNQIVRK